MDGARQQQGVALGIAAELEGLAPWAPMLGLFGAAAEEEAGWSRTVNARLWQAAPLGRGEVMGMAQVDGLLRSDRAPQQVTLGIRYER